MRLGIKSEIHDCMIEIISFLEKQEVIEKDTAKMLENDKELRINNQYYLKNRPVGIDYNALRGFVLRIKKIINTITNERIEKVRKEIKRAIKL